MRGREGGWESRWRWDDRGWVERFKREKAGLEKVVDGWKRVEEDVRSGKC